MKETKKQILIRLNKNTDLIKKEERKNKDTDDNELALPKSDEPTPIREDE
jgi:hypothetical protein